MYVNIYNSPRTPPYQQGQDLLPLSAQHFKPFVSARDSILRKELEGLILARIDWKTDTEKIRKCWNNHFNDETPSSPTAILSDSSKLNKTMF